MGATTRLSAVECVHPGPRALPLTSPEAVSYCEEAAVITTPLIVRDRQARSGELNSVVVKLGCQLDWTWEQLRVMSL